MLAACNFFFYSFYVYPRDIMRENGCKERRAGREGCWDEKERWGDSFNVAL